MCIFTYCRLFFVLISFYCFYGVLCRLFVVFFFSNQKTAYEVRISDWSSDVCSSDLGAETVEAYKARVRLADADVDGEDALGPRQRIELGLITLAAREEELYLAHHAGQIISRRVLIGLIAKAGRLRDGVKNGGIKGYIIAADHSLPLSFGLRAATTPP